jgi:hypothetical protein
MAASKFGGIPVDEPPAGGSKFGGIPVESSEAAAAPIAIAPSGGGIHRITPSAAQMAEVEANNNADLLQLAKAKEKDAEAIKAKLEQAVKDKDILGIAENSEQLGALNREIKAGGGTPVSMPSLIPEDMKPLAAASAPSGTNETGGKKDTVNTGGSYFDTLTPFNEKVFFGVSGAGAGGIGGFKAKAVKDLYTKWVTRSNNANDAAQMGQANSSQYGNTPKQAETAHNENTSQRAKRAQKQGVILENVGLDPTAKVAGFSDIGASEEGLILSKEAQAELNEKRAAQAQAANQSTWQKLMARAEEFQKNPNPAYQKIGAALKNKAIDAWKNGLFEKENWVGRGASTGLGVGLAVPSAVDKFRQNDTAGAVQDVGTGATLGWAMSHLPQRVALPVSSGLQAADAGVRANKGDYLGAGLSAFGAAAPYIVPFILAPEFAIPAAIAAGAGPVVINAVRDWVNSQPASAPQQGALPVQAGR